MFALLQHLDGEAYGGYYGSGIDTVVAIRRTLSAAMEVATRDLQQVVARHHASFGTDHYRSLLPWYTIVDSQGRSVATTRVTVTDRVTLEFVAVDSRRPAPTR